MIDSRAFVRQHYLDFLDREPDVSGWDFWTDRVGKVGEVEVSRAFWLVAQPALFNKQGNCLYSDSFILLCYKYYLQRSVDSSDAGYQFWLKDLNLDSSVRGVRHVISAFITSDDYKLRFIPILSSIPEPSGTIIKVSEMNPKLSLTEKIIAAEKILGNSKGSIVVDVQGELVSRIDISGGHSLHFGPGTWDIVSGRDDFPFVLGDESGFFGAGIDKTIFLEPEHGYSVIATKGLLTRDQGFDFVGVTTGFRAAGFTVQGGRQKIGEGGARSTIATGNSKNCRIWQVKLSDTSCLGISIGGMSSTGNDAEGNIVEDCQFEGVAAQSLSLVHGKNNIFRRCSFKRPGKAGWSMPTCVDLEPNADTDWLIDNVIEDLWIDASDAAFKCNGIVVQCANAKKENLRGNIVRRCKIAGFRSDQVGKGLGFGVAGGILIAGQSSGQVTDCNLFACGQHGLYVGDSDNIVVERLNLNSCGWDVQKAVEVFNSNHCTFNNNSAHVTENIPFGRTEIVETGNSAQNKFKGNTGKVITLPGNGSVVEN